MDGTPMTKFVIDTNSLLRNPEVLYEGNVILTSMVLRELEHLELKKENRQLQYEIRKAKRVITKLREEENLLEILDISDFEDTLVAYPNAAYADNVILAYAWQYGYGLLTGDQLLIDKAISVGVPYKSPETDTAYVEHKGYKTITLSGHQIKDLFQSLEHNPCDLLTNEYLIVKNLTGETEAVLRWTGYWLEDAETELARGFNTRQFGSFVPKDEQQIMAVNSIVNNQLTIIRGKAGTGKSLLTLNTAWKLVEKEGYRLVIFTNPTPLKDAQELGFFKGDQLDKILQTSLGIMLKSKFGDMNEVRKQIEYGTLDILPFVELRGYDTGDSKTCVWITESQNLSKNLLKLGLQRIAENTKVIIDGDYSAQVDRDSYMYDNGMKRASEVFRGNEIFGEIELEHIYRSRLANIADQM